MFDRYTVPDTFEQRKARLVAEPSRTAHGYERLIVWFWHQKGHHPVGNSPHAEVPAFWPVTAGEGVVPDEALRVRLEHVLNHIARHDVSFRLVGVEQPAFGLVIRILKDGLDHLQGGSQTSAQHFDQ